MHFWKYFTIFSALFYTAACAKPLIRDDLNHDSTSLQRSLETNGVWQSDGFGYVMRIENNDVRFFHITRHFCIETNSPNLELDNIFDVYRLVGPNTMFMSTTTEPFEFKFTRIADIPPACLREGDSSIKSTAKVLIDYLTDHYVFFDQRGLDRDQFMADIEQASVQASNELDFYTAITSILSRTRDAHVELSAMINGEVLRFDGDPGMIRRLISLRASNNGTSERGEREAFIREFWVEGIGERILKGKSKFAANDRIRYGLIDGNIGYIAVRSMGGYIDSDESNGATESEVLSNTMDAAIAEFDEARARAIILDISINSGGYEYLSRQLAGRFFDKRRSVYQLYAGDAQDQKPQTMFVEPEGRSQFIGPVYLLTSSETVSAAESLTMAMRANPEVTHVGDQTRGALSTKLAKLLPNGWELMLSNQVILDHEGRAWEGNAAAPEIFIPIFPNRSIRDDALIHFDFADSHYSAVTELVAHVRSEVDQK